MLVTIFSLSAFLLFYVYLGYPLLQQCLPHKKRHKKHLTQLPSITILIAAYNEEIHIGKTLENKLALDYPAEKLNILVVSDASTDNTDSIFKAIADKAALPIALVRQDTGQGKTAGLNRLVEIAEGEILVFSDANSLYNPQALKQLVQQFAEPQVGYITGKLIYTQEDGSIVGEGCSRYMQYENWLRQQETDISSIVGVDGGIDAMRKALYTPLKTDQLPDFVQPLSVIEQGYEVRYEPKARLYEQALQQPRTRVSYARKSLFKSAMGHL